VENLAASRGAGQRRPTASPPDCFDVARQGRRAGGSSRRPVADVRRRGDRLLATRSMTFRPVMSAAAGPSSAPTQWLLHARACGAIRSCSTNPLAPWRSATSSSAGRRGASGRCRCRCRRPAHDRRRGGRRRRGAPTVRGPQGFLARADDRAPRRRPYRRTVLVRGGLLGLPRRADAVHRRDSCS
jgi:hypothetical protein